MLIDCCMKKNCQEWYNEALSKLPEELIGIGWLTVHLLEHLGKCRLSKRGEFIEPGTPFPIANSNIVLLLQYFLREINMECMDDILLPIGYDEFLEFLYDYDIPRLITLTAREDTLTCADNNKFSAEAETSTKKNGS